MADNQSHTHELIGSAPRGTRDLYGATLLLRHRLLNLFWNQAEQFGLIPIQTPSFEQKVLFLKGVGEETDIVQKEMYDLTSHGEELDLALRPEGTAGVVRAYIEHGMASWPQPVRLAYAGTMFRHERPQRGRYRELSQVGVEILGSSNPSSEATVMFFMWLFAKRAGILEPMIKLGSTGDAECRPKYEKKLQHYFREFAGELCSDCTRRLENRPMRILDCKNPRCQKIAEKAPSVLDNLCKNCEQHFKEVIEAADLLAVPYEIDARLARGLDYYTRTVFELFHSSAKEALALGGGGRYDGLVELYGGQKTPAIGMAIGIDRLEEALQSGGAATETKQRIDVFLVIVGELAKQKALQLYTILIQEDLSVVMAPDKESLRSQLKAADQAGASQAVIIGQQEANGGQAIVRDMETGKQETMDLLAVPEYLHARLGHISAE